VESKRKRELGRAAAGTKWPTRSSQRLGLGVEGWREVRLRGLRTTAQAIAGLKSQSERLHFEVAIGFKKNKFALLVVLRGWGKTVVSEAGAVVVGGGGTE
jgi:hypothetical protein